MPASGPLSSDVRNNPWPPLRIAVALGAVLALVVGLSAGLDRLGVSTGISGPGTDHGPLLVLGFFGAVIGVERAVGLRRRWAWAAPILAVASIVASVGGLGRQSASIAAAASGIALCAVFVAAYRIQPELHLRVMMAGAVFFVGAAVAWLTGSALGSLVPWFAGFLVLTITGERLELARVLKVPAYAARLLLAAIGVLGVGVAWSLADLTVGSRLAGIGLIGISIWLLRHDVARRTLRMTGVTRYMAVALLAGYFWSAVAGAIWVAAGLVPGTLSYDAAVHGLFLGFVISMVFAHAPVIIPAVTRLDFPYNPLLWVPLMTLHLSLLLRVVGDLAGWPDVRELGGVANVIALALFAVVAASLVVSRLMRSGRGHE